MRDEDRIVLELNEADAVEVLGALNTASSVYRITGNNVMADHFAELSDRLRDEVRRALTPAQKITGVGDSKPTPRRPK